MDEIEWLYAPGLRGSVEQRFWKMADRRGDNECWPWTGAPTSRGYGRIQTRLSKSTPAHRVSLLLSGRSIPDGMVVDHICRNRMCVNPWHLRTVTPKVNTLENSAAPSAANALKTHCKRGHEFTPENTTLIATGRTCRTCREAYAIEYRKTHRPARVRRESVLRRLDEANYTQLYNRVHFAVRVQGESYAKVADENMLTAREINSLLCKTRQCILRDHILKGAE